MTFEYFSLLSSYITRARDFAGECRRGKTRTY